jgi:hypothetical protein
MDGGKCRSASGRRNQRLMMGEAADLVLDPEFFLLELDQSELIGARSLIFLGNGLFEGGMFLG